MGLVRRKIGPVPLAQISGHIKEGTRNSSSVDLAGLDKPQAKELIYKRGLIGNSAAVAFLAWVIDQHRDKYTICVKTAKEELRLGRVRWEGVREILREMGVLTQTKTPLPDGSHFWQLSIDLGPLIRHASLIDANPDKNSQQPTHHARTHVRARDVSKSTLKPIGTQPAPPPLTRAKDLTAKDLSLKDGTETPAQASGAPAVPLPPRGGRAVFNTPEGNNDMDEFPTVDELFPLPGTNPKKEQQPRHEPVPLAGSSIDEATEFFNWLGRNDVLKVQLAAQTRKLNGDRGAPMGFGNGKNAVALGAPVPSSRAVDIAQSLLARLEHMGKKNLELVTYCAEDSTGMSRVTLVDDLAGPDLARLKEIWDWQGCVLETSPDNFQAVLISREPMGRDDRKSVTDQLVSLLGGDNGAKGPQQFHRLPGSVNYKRALERPFVTRLHEFFKGKGSGVKPVKKIAPAPARTASVASRLPGLVRPLRKINWSKPTDNPSTLAFRLAVELLWSGATGAAVLDALRQPDVLRSHDPKDWPERTLRKAVARVESWRAGRKG